MTYRDEQQDLHEIASGGYPSWPFGRLSDKAMAELLGRLDQPRKASLYEELGEFEEALL